MNETENINYTLLERARVMIFAAHGAPVEVGVDDGAWISRFRPRWNWKRCTYRISPEWLVVPEGYELVPMGEEVPVEIPSKGCRILGANDEDHEWRPFVGADNSNPYNFVARPIAEARTAHSAADQGGGGAMSKEHIADTVCMTVTLDCDGVKLITNSGMVYITGADDSDNTYEIPLEIWRLFNNMVEKMED